MGTTPVYSWPYPELNNSPDGATQMKQLALAIEPTTKTLADRVTTLETPPPLTVVRQTVAQNGIGNGAYTPINFDGEDVDTSNMHSTSTNKNRLTCVIPGWYQMAGGATFHGGVAASRRLLFWYFRDARVMAQPAAMTLSASSSQDTDATASVWVVKLIVGDYIGLNAFHDGGTGVNVVNGYVAAQFIRP